MGPTLSTLLLFSFSSGYHLFWQSLWSGSSPYAPSYSLSRRQPALLILETSLPSQDVLSRVSSQTVPLFRPLSVTSGFALLGAAALRPNLLLLEKQTIVFVSPEEKARIFASLSSSNGQVRRTDSVCGFLCIRSIMCGSILNFFTRQILEILTGRTTKVATKLSAFTKGLVFQSIVVGADIERQERQESFRARAASKGMFTDSYSF